MTITGTLLRRCAALLVAATLVCIAPSARAQTHIITLQEMNNSGESGTATLNERGPDLEISIVLKGMSPDAPPELAHIHAGTCDHLGNLTSYELSPVTDGRSSSVLKGVSLSTFTSGAYALTIHKALAKVSLHVACGSLSSTQ